MDVNRFVVKTENGDDERHSGGAHASEDGSRLYALVGIISICTPSDQSLIIHTMSYMFWMLATLHDCECTFC